MSDDIDMRDIDMRDIDMRDLDRMTHGVLQVPLTPGVDSWDAFAGMGDVVIAIRHGGAEGYAFMDGVATTCAMDVDVRYEPDGITIQQITTVRRNGGGEA